MTLANILYLQVVVVFFSWISSAQETRVMVTSCPRDINTSTENGHPWARVSWEEPIFTTVEGERKFPRKSHTVGQRFYIGDTSVTYTLPPPYRSSDVRCVFKIRVVDNEPPRVVHCPATVTVNTNRGRHFATNVRWAKPIFQDNVVIEEIESSHDEEDSFPLGNTEVTYIADDEAGNRAKCVFNVTVIDSEPPVINNCPLDIIALASGSDRTRAVDWISPSTTDNSGHAEMTSQYYPGYHFELGHTTVSYIARDRHRNEAVCSFSVFIKASVPENRIYIRAVTTTSIKLAWPETTDIRASSYLIYVWKVNRREPMPYEHIYHLTDHRQAVATRTIHNLTPGELYNIRIVVTGVASSIFTRQRTLPSPPENVLSDETSLGSTSFVLNWSAGTGVFTKYHVVIRNVQTSEVILDRKLGRRYSTLKVAGLEPDTKYACAVTALSGGEKNKEESDPETCEVRTRSLPPFQLEAHSLTSSSLSVFFRFSPQAANSGTVSEDAVEASHAVFLYDGNVEAFVDTTFPRSDGVSSFTFSSLYPLKNYTVKVIDNESGRLLMANYLTQPPEVTQLRATYVSDTSVRIIWDRINLRGIMYEIDVSPRPLHMEQLITTDLTECFLDHLVTMETYLVTLTSVYGHYRSSPVSIEVTPGLDNKDGVSPSEHEKSCAGAIVLYILFLLTTLLLTVYIVALFRWTLPPCMTPARLKTEAITENHYEEPEKTSIFSAADSLRLPSFAPGLKEQINGLVAKRGIPFRFWSTRTNVYNTSSEKRAEDEERRKKKNRLTRLRAQSERTVPRLKRSSSTSALYLNVRRHQLEGATLMEMDTDLEESIHLSDPRESIIWC